MTRTVLVPEPAPPKTIAEMETTVITEASVGVPSPCGGAPDDVLALQYRLINAGDYEGAYELFAEESKQVISSEQYGSFFDANAPYSLTDYSFPSVEVRDEAATVRTAFTVVSAAGQESLERVQELVCEGRSWLVLMREEQVAAFAGTEPEPQYEEAEPHEETPAPEITTPAPDNPPASDPQYEPEPQQPEPEPQYGPATEPPPSAPPGGDVDCSNFGSSAEAQPHLLPGDPHNLDADGDGRACDSPD